MARIFLLMAVVATVACDSGGEAPTPATVSPPVATATHGGTLVPLARHRVELVAHGSGEVFGYVVSPTGEPIASPESALLTVTVTLDADHVRPILLRWNPDAGRHEARLRDAPVEGPADVSLVVAGRPERGSIDRLPVQPALEASGVAYAEELEEDDDEGDPEEGEGEDEADGSGGGRGGSLRARARRLFGL